MDFFQNVFTLQFMVSSSRRVAGFATVLTLALPALSKDRISARA